MSLHILMDAKLISALEQPSNLFFFALMVALAIVDCATYFVRSGASHRNFKGEIVGLGILGTFFGIFIGLQTFDPADIQSSIPPLLDGLKTAFLTSIAGMGISMFLTVLQAFFRTQAALRADDPLQALLQDLLAATQKANQDSLAHQASLLDQFRNGRMEQRDEALKVRQVFESSFATMNASLQEALTKLSEGASKEIIKALEDVIKDFNQNLTDQFGENFKQLNSACLKLVEWQDNYKVIIERVEATLRQSTDAISATDKTLESIAKKNVEFGALCVRLGDVISTSDVQVQALNSHLAHQKTLTESVSGLLSEAKLFIGVANEQLRGATERIERTIAQVVQRSETSISNADVQFTKMTASVTANFTLLQDQQRDSLAAVAKGFTTHCNSISTTLQDARVKLDDVSTKMQGSLTAQAQSLADLTKRTSEVTDKTRDELAASLRQMNSALSSLTNQFGTNYREFLAGIERLMPR